MDGNERLIQALIRLVVTFVIAGLGALGANITILNDAIDDKVFAAMVVAVATAVISALTKYLGGATAPLSGGRARGAGADGVAVSRPNPFAI